MYTRNLISTIGLKSIGNYDLSNEYEHMYTPGKMIRNLGLGNVGEAFFRYWYETHCNGLDDLSLRQFGYNPKGVIVGKEKPEMLKQLERSTDFAVYRVDDLESDPMKAKPILGISINTQKHAYDMNQARAPRMEYKGSLCGCFNCPRGNVCFDDKVDNLWYNEYNISNDYMLFYKEFRADVLMVSIISKMPYAVWNRKISEGQFDKELREYLIKGKLAIEQNRSIVEFLDYLLFDQRYRKRTRPRGYGLVWLLYSDILEGKVSYHVTGAPVSRGRPRPVACIDILKSRSEQELVRFIEKRSKLVAKTLSPDWYVKMGTKEK